MSREGRTYGSERSFNDNEGLSLSGSFALNNRDEHDSPLLYSETTHEAASGRATLFRLRRLNSVTAITMSVV